VSRHLRFAFLLAALVAAGPMPSARAVDAARVTVGIAWFQGDRIVTPRSRQSNDAIPGAVVAHRAFNAHPAPGLSPVVLPHSLFQRPPPFLG
jgi:hypothetical protein